MVIRAIKSKKGFEMSFTLLFSMIAGTVILIIAIYAAVRFINQNQQFQYSSSAASLIAMFNPVANDISSAIAPEPINFNRETRIYLYADSTISSKSAFGMQKIGFSEQSSFLKEWPEPSLNISFKNKYIFSEDIIQGKKLFIFAKPFYSGFKVDDLVVLYFRKYCFINPPEFISQDIEDNILKNSNFTNNIQKCPKESLKVCFDYNFGGCNIVVNPECSSECGELGEYEFGSVSKNSTTVKYYDNLLYAAIFSSPKIYSENLKRLGFKASALSKVYLEKAELIKIKNCDSNAEPFLTEMIELGKNLTSSKLSSFRENANLIKDEEGKKSDCLLFRVVN